MIRGTFAGRRTWRLKYRYDDDDRLTSRWSAARGTTTYQYDHVGNLTKITYPVSHGVTFKWDAMNRFTNMVDGVGSTVYTYTSTGVDPDIPPEIKNPIVQALYAFCIGG